MADEKDLYGPVRESLIRLFWGKGTCRLWITGNKVVDDAKDGFNPISLMMLKLERKRPDLMGHIWEKKPLPRLSTIVVGVKTVAKMRDIYQTKMYADILSPRYAFFVAREGFNKEQRDFLRTHHYILEYGKRRLGKQQRQITVMTINQSGDLIQDAAVSAWDPFSLNPFIDGLA